MYKYKLYTQATLPNRMCNRSTISNTHSKCKYIAIYDINNDINLYKVQKSYKTSTNKINKRRSYHDL